MLGDLSRRLGDAEWLAYVARAEARPAFRRAFAAQLAVFTSQQPAG